MNYLLLFISVFTDSLKNMYYNQFSNTKLKENRDAVLFNIVSCVGSVIFFLILDANFKVSSYSIIMAIIFAAVTTGAQFFSLLAISLGSMSYSVLFTYLSMLIPTFFGVIKYGQVLGPVQWIGLLFMLITFFLSVDLKSENSTSLKWFIVVMASFVCWGLVGVCQQLHQNSPYAAELDGFLLWTFIFSTLMFALLWIITPKNKTKSLDSYKIISKSTIFVIVAGIIIGAVNKINLYLSGAMVSYIFFPIVNGGVIILSSLASIIIFREKLSRNQLIGLLFGIASVLCLGI